MKYPPHVVWYKNINPSITQQESVEMLSQHIITKPVFDALFSGYSFVQNNPISVSMQTMLDLLEEKTIDEDAQTLNKFSQAQSFFTKCIDEFPDFKNRGAAIFLLAQLYDDASKLNNEEEAAKYYRQVIREYPKSAFAEDAKAAIKNFGKTDEQLIQEFLKKNK